jgi:hypothetical protein
MNEHDLLVILLGQLLENAHVKILQRLKDDPLALGHVDAADNPAAIDPSA